MKKSMFLMFSTLLFLGGCKKDNVYVYKQLSCQETPWKCMLDCGVGLPAESVGAFSFYASCLTEFLQKKGVMVYEAKMDFRHSNGYYPIVCGEPTGTLVIVKASPLSAPILRNLGFKQK